jgi:hypothetical protein
VAQDAYDEAKKQDDDAKAALDLATQQEADAEKQREAGSILFVVFGEKLVSECRIPTAAVAQRGLFRILLGSSGVPEVVSDVINKNNVYGEIYDRIGVKQNDDGTYSKCTSTYVSPMYDFNGKNAYRLNLTSYTYMFADAVLSGANFAAERHNKLDYDATHPFTCVPATAADISEYTALLASYNISGGSSIEPNSINTTKPGKGTDMVAQDASWMDAWTTTNCADSYDINACLQFNRVMWLSSIKT